MTPIEALLQDFKKYLHNLGYHKNTVQRLPVQVQSFFVYHSISDPQSITPQHILSYYEWLQTRPHQLKEGGISEAHIAHHLYSLSLLLGWLEATGQIKHNPMSALHLRRGVKKKREALSIEAVQALFAAAQTERERALLHLLYSCGLRRSEAVALDLGDVHFKAKMLYVRRGKGCKRRAVPLTDKVAAALEGYYQQERNSTTLIKSFGHSGYRHPTAFLLNKTGGRMQGDSYDDLLRALKNRAGMEDQTVTPHYLRHSIATHLLAAGVPIEQVKDFLGHSVLEATQIYTQVYAHQLRGL